MNPRALTLACLAALAGCTVGPEYRRPDIALPDQWQSPTGATPAAVDLSRWWTGFDDATLASLTQRALAANLDLRLAEARLREARAQLRVVGADRYPVVDAVGDISSQRRSGNGRQGMGGLEDTQFQAGFDASWEIDVFGGVRRNVRAANADLDAAESTRDDALVSLAAEVARHYVNLRSDQHRLAIAGNNIRVQQEALSLAESRFKAGLTSELDVTQAQALLATTQAQVPALEQQAQQSVHAIEVLLGQMPGSLTAELNAPGRAAGEPARWAALHAPLPTGLPSDLLRRRPDIRVAERRLAAAVERVGVATAELYPRFLLTGAAGLQSVDADDFFSGSSRFYSLGPSVRWPLLNFGRARAQVRVAGARQDQALALYEKSILVALSEVESALVAHHKEQARHASLTTAVDAQRRALSLATSLYQKGLVNYLNVIDAQRQLHAGEDLLAQSDRALAQNLIALFKALGGGWQPPDPAMSSLASRSDASTTQPAVPAPTP